MYKLILETGLPLAPFRELIDVFLPPDQYHCLSAKEAAQGISGSLNDGSSDAEGPDGSGEEALVTRYYRAEEPADEKNQLKRLLYQDLSRWTGRTPEWGILTGIRPVKLAGELMEQGQAPEQVRRHLEEAYLVHPEKAAMVTAMYLHQVSRAGRPEPDSAGVYIGIPFCPTRCLYCSFPSHQGGAQVMEAYLKALHREIRFAGGEMKRLGMRPESLYLGGGTPTTLTAAQLLELMEHWGEAFDLSRCREITVEAGRPDTITEEKLKVLRDHGVTRISINPQTMQDKTLALIGRRHSAGQIRQAFQAARRAEIRIINADLIAGLPEETFEDFTDTLRQILELEPENITLHTLAVKRASRLMETDPQLHHRRGALVSGMMKEAVKQLRQAGYIPYYLYRQKHMAGALENIGFAKCGSEGLYNIRVMDEHQTIVALGAGAISKRYYPGENRLERIANVSDYSLYIQRIEEMLRRKAHNLFQEVEINADKRT